MNKVELAEGVYWVGAIDWNIRNFHGLKTPRGTTYNAYLIVDEEACLIDAVDARFGGEMMGRIKAVVDPRDISYIVSNHSEIDHSGAIPLVLEEARDAQVVATPDGVKRLEEIFRGGFNYLPVADGQELPLGEKKLRFIHAPMLHWPETMFTYLPQAKILFPCDAFGAHLATSRRFADEVDDVLPYCKKYYAFLVSPYSRAVQKALEKTQGLDIDVIAPSHGPIWRRNLDRLLANYRNWAEGRLRDKAVIAYATMWESTARMARAVAEGISSEGVEVVLFNLADADWSEVVMEVMDSKAVVLGTPTFVGGVYPMVEVFLPYLAIPRPKGKIGAVFGSYGWGGGALKKLSSAMGSLGLVMLDGALDLKFSPDEKGLAKCEEFGRAIARRVRA